jgi:hypothetical protein
MDLKGISSAMKAKNMICIPFICLILASSAFCLAEDKTSTASLDLKIPNENLPEGFKLLAALPEMDSTVNMTDYIKEFYGSKNIGPANVSVGIYQWGKPPEAYDAKITFIQLQDEGYAESAVSNYKSQETYKNLLARGYPIFGNATINGHEALEIKDIRGDESIRYLYLWNIGNIVAFVEGNGDMGKSRDLASATKL